MPDELRRRPIMVGHVPPKCQQHVAGEHQVDHADAHLFDMNGCPEDQHEAGQQRRFDNDPDECCPARSESSCPAASGRAHYTATQGYPILWFENGAAVYGFKNAEQAAAFKAWVDTCGIDWTKNPRDGPISDFDKPAERPLLYGPTPRGR